MKRFITSLLMLVVLCGAARAEVLIQTSTGAYLNKASLSSAVASNAKKILVTSQVKLSAPVSLKTGTELEIGAGGSIVANSDFTGEGLIIVDAGGTDISAMQNVYIHGAGIIDAAGYADRGVYVKMARQSRISGLTINGSRLSGVHVGAPGAGASSYEVTTENVTVRNRSGVTNDPASIGVYYQNATDSVISNGVTVGYRTGLRSDGGSNVFIDCHPWTLTSYGPMVYGFYLKGLANVAINPYADTPTNAGNGAITAVYGIFIDNYNIHVLNPKVYLSSGGGAVNNIATAVYINKAGGGYGAVVGGHFSTDSSSCKFKKLYDSIDGLFTNETIIGYTNDGNFNGGAIGYFTPGTFTADTLTSKNIMVPATLTTATIRNADSGNGAILGINPLPADGLSASRVRLFRDVNTSESATTGFSILKADGTANSQHTLYAKGNAVFGEGGGGAYNQGHLQLGNFHIWVEQATGKLRIKGSAPISDSDGAIVGQQ